MTSTGAKSATSAANNTTLSPAGTVPWSDLGNAVDGSSSTAATAVLNASGSFVYAEALVLTGFDFSEIDDAATIDSLIVTVTRMGGTISDQTNKLVTAADGITGNNKNGGAWGSSQSVVTFGTAGFPAETDWGIPLSGAIVKAPGFGFATRPVSSTTSSSGTASLFAVTMTVTYTNPPHLTISSDGVATSAATLISPVRLAGTPTGLATPSVALQSPALVTLAANGTSNADANIEGAPQIPVEAAGQATVVVPVRSRVLASVAADGTATATAVVTNPVPMAMASAGSSTTAGQVAVVRNDVGSRTPPAGFSSGLQRPPRGSSFRSSGPR